MSPIIHFTHSPLHCCCPTDQEHLPSFLFFSRSLIYFPQESGLWYLLLCILVGGLRMYIGITQRRIGSVKEVGKIKMSVGIIAYYNLMQVCQAEYFRQLLKPVT
uniref:Uncharacterized protein n=1 Tax=Lactuca sativa TaxID=4236 RepID=A0A9R1UZ03_LACSA|nr:hypothetical protein LSAT_V11C700355720 [Lactuca sativa]